MRALRRHRRSADEGAAAVEFAIVAPLLIFLVFAMIDFGIVFAQQLSLNNAVREGARYAVVSGNAANQTCAGVVDTVRNAAGGTLVMDTSLITVSVSTQTAAGTAVTPGKCSGTGSATTKVCSGSTTAGGAPNSIVVEATYQSNFVVPLFPIPGALGGAINAPQLKSKAVYRCEFT